MKNLRLWLIVLPLLTIACTDDNHSTSEMPDSAIMPKSNLPDNPANPYDQAGRSHNAVLDIYDISYRPDANIVEVSEKIDSIAGLDPHLQFTIPLSVKETVIRGMVADGNMALQEVLATPPLSTNAKIKLQGLVDLLENNGQASVNELQGLISTYEEGIITSSGFNTLDKRILLTTSSIVRFSIFRKRRKDKDWETSVGHIAAMAYGAKEDMSLSVRMAATVGLCYNDGIIE